MADRENHLTNANDLMSYEDPSTVRRRRIQFRCWHRGTQESDLVLGSFAEHYVARMDNFQLDRFEALLECSDPDLFDWIFGISTPPAEHAHDVFRMVRTFWVERNCAGLPISPRHFSPTR